ncbi:hypothetical protein KJ762_05415 [bacterium]|nr:hypothetical protein [bacterium]MBU1633934.1 hypothetical protein [bacterium]MBU1873836.1 hypothetical protein [bacterium]
MSKQRFYYLILTIFLILLFGSPFFQCSKPASYDGPKFILQNPQTLIPNIVSNYIISSRFDTDGQTVIFNGRLDGDSWDCIYTIPVQGGDYRKIIESTDDLLFPSFSDDRSKIIYARGFARQVMLYNIESGESTELPIFGNTPILLPDNATVLYSGVIDANLKLYHIPSRQSKNLTESYVSANFSPVLLSDDFQLRWIEKLRNGLYKLNRGDLESDKSNSFHTDRKAIYGITVSPSGQWNLVNFQDGSLIGVHGKDSTTATVEIQVDNDDLYQMPLISLPDWSVSGSRLVYTSVPSEKFATVNPFFKHGYYKADLVVASLKWEKINNGDIFRSLAPQTVSLFPETAPANITTTTTTQKTNNPPKIVSMPPATVLQGDVFIYRVSAVDIDLFDDLEYRQTGGPVNAEMLAKSGILYWVAEEPGDYQFSVAVSDNSGETDRQTFAVNVLPRPDWKRSEFVHRPKPEIQNEYLAGMVFKDPNNDGFLSPGENASLLIDLKSRSFAMDSVKLHLLTTVFSGEIEMEHELIFERCVPDQWTRKIIPIKGLEGLQNRPIVIRGILQNSSGITLLPASLVISAKNPGIQKN